MKAIIEKYGILFVFIILCIYFGIIITVRPWVDCDLLEGVFSLNNYLNGYGFNRAYSVDQNLKISNMLLTYWVPGQYVYPFLFAKLFHVNIANGIIICNIFFLTAGFYMYYIVLRHFKFNNFIIFSSILILVSQRFFNGILLKMPAVDQYLILFSCLALLLLEKYYASESFTKNALYTLSFFLVFLLGLFTKNSFLLFIIFITLFYFIYHLRKLFTDRIENKLVSFIKISIPGIILVICYGLFYLLFYSNGRTPVDTKYDYVHNTFSLLKICNIIFKPIIETVGAVFSFDALLFRIPSPNNSYFAYITDFKWQGILIGTVFIAPLVYIIGDYLIKFKNNKFTWFAVFIIAFYALFFSVCIIKQSDVYAEDRLFLPMILFALPVFCSVFTSNSKLKYVLGIYLVISVVFSVSSISNNNKYYKKGRVIERQDMISGFLIHSETENFEELKQIGVAINSKSLKNNLLLANSPEQFLLTNVNSPSIIVNGNNLTNIDSFVSINAQFFKKNKTEYLSLLTKSNMKVVSHTTEIIQETHFKDNALYIFRLH